MDYARHYDRLIDRARARVVDGYSERHHVVPRCMGGSDDAANLVSLTAEEHFVAHQLLVKMHPKDHRLLWALSAMTHKTKRMGRPQNKRYGWLRRRFAKTVGARWKGRKHTDESRAKMSVSRAGAKRRPHTEETKAKMSAKARLRVRSPEHCEALSRAKTGAKYQPRSQESRRRSSEAIKLALSTKDLSFRQDPAYRAAQAERMRQIWAERRLKTKG